MNANQRAKNRRTARDLERKVRQMRNRHHICENCGEPGGHWVTVRGASLAALVTGKDDSEGYWACPPKNPD